MAIIDLAANLQGASDARVGMGRILGLGLAAVGTSGQGIGRKAPSPPAGYPKQTLKVGEMRVVQERGVKC